MATPSALYLHLPFAYIVAYPPHLGFASNTSSGRAEDSAHEVIIAQQDCGLASTIVRGRTVLGLRELVERFREGPDDNACADEAVEGDAGWRAVRSRNGRGCSFVDIYPETGRLMRRLNLNV